MGLARQAPALRATPRGMCPARTQVMDEIVYRTARGMAAEGVPFRGTLFAGLMIKDGKVRCAAPTEGRRAAARRLAV